MEGLREQFEADFPDMLHFIKRNPAGTKYVKERLFNFKD